jgi:RNA polymerase primary sigma factor
MKLYRIIKDTNYEGKSILQRYYRELRKSELLTPTEEKELGKRIREGDRLALNKLVEANLRFVIFIAKRFSNRGVPLSDLIGAGNYGLIKAAEGFDESLGNRFISYAVWWIRQSISARFLQAKSIRISYSRISLLRKFNKLKLQHEREGILHLGYDQYAEELQITCGELSDLMRLYKSPVSIDAPYHPEYTEETANILEDPEGTQPDKRLIAASLRSDLQQALNILKENERQVLILHYGLGELRAMNLDAIGEHLNLTRERVRQIKQSALRKLKKKATSLLQGYLGYSWTNELHSLDQEVPEVREFPDENLNKGDNDQTDKPITVLTQLHDTASDAEALNNVYEEITAIVTDPTEVNDPTEQRHKKEIQELKEKHYRELKQAKDRIKQLEELLNESSQLRTQNQRKLTDEPEQLS